MVNAAMAQLVEHILGKDEVPGPNPGSSSRQPRREIFGALVFISPCLHRQGFFWFFWGCLELLLSLRLGHLRGLTVHWTVIQHPQAATLLSLRSVFSHAKRRKPVRIPHLFVSSLLVSDK